MRTFEQVWDEQKKQGYDYGKEALDNVRFGWALAILETSDLRREGQHCHDYRKALLHAVGEVEQLEKTLTAAQTRCTELLNELRKYKESSALPGLGWDCKNCGAFNGSMKEELTACRCCDAPRSV